MANEPSIRHDFTKGPLFEEGLKRWLVEVRYPNGRRVRKRFRRQREALRFWAGENVKIETGTWQPSALRNITFGQALDRYRAHAKVEVPSYHSYTEPALKVWEDGIPNDTLLGRVTPAMIDAIKVRRAQEVKKCSVDRNLQVLRRLFNWCIEQSLAAENPVRHVKFFRAETKRLRYLTNDEYKHLLDEAAKVKRSRFLPEAIELSVHTGLRRGNLFGLKWAWVDWLNRVIRVPRSKSGRPHAVPLNATAYAALQCLWAGRSDSPYVFAHAKGKNAGEAVQDPKRGFHTAVENAGIEDFRWHDLRHTFASWLVMRGASLRAVAELMGHQTMQMTMRYAHLSPGHLSNEVRLLDGVGREKRARKGQRAQTPESSGTKNARNSEEKWRALQDSNLRPPGS